ncbi:SPOR domain-containing protein [Pseudomonas matsuisoli]|uniref:Cell division protein n=1 Tax=Pseudomonas matsuisoli TaxID=1515666 RepID=A0A917PYB3_9PSED|nr:SPOR domain-containing protein [Pseudomonas matsuisoli]GGJ99322.1 cell division protein [Pseudomonas matsuisoli]
MAKRKAPAKRGASRTTASKKNSTVPGWMWLACGLVVGGFFTFLFNLEPGRDDIKRPSPEEKVAKKETAPEATKPKYDFYTLLPESEVIVPPEAVPQQPAVTPPKPVTPEEAAKIDEARAQAALSGQVPPPPPTVAKAATTTQFFLQAGSFRRKDDAESVRAQIILLGQQVRVESGTVRDETWHRVLVGPFAERGQLDAAQKELKGHGFNNLLLQQRKSG